MLKSELKEDIQVCSNEAQREMKKKEKLEQEFKQVKAEAESKTSELKMKQAHLQKAQEEGIWLEQQLKEQHILNEQAVKDTELLNNRLIKLQQDFDSQLSTAEQLGQENNQRHIKLKGKEDEVNALKQDSVCLTRQREAIQRKLCTIEDQKVETAPERDLEKLSKCFRERAGSK